MATSFPNAAPPSTLLALVVTLGACGWNLGMPPSARWSVDHVDAPVAEPGIDDALLRALRRGGVAAEGGFSVSVRVTEATWSPSGAYDGATAWRATLAVDVAAAGQHTRLRVSRLVAPSTSAGDAADARATAFASMANTLAPDIAAWLDTVNASP